MQKRSKVVFIAPPASVREYYRHNKDVVFIDETGWSIFDSNSGFRQSISIFDKPIDWSISPSLQEVLKALREWFPVWARWVAPAEKYEMLYREAYLYVAHAVQSIQCYGVKAAIFFTGSPQHLDTTLMRTAFGVAKIPSVFLYIDIVSGRLIPKVQRDSIFIRENLEFHLSDFDATESINRFVENRTRGFAPVLNVKYSELDRSYVFAYLEAVYLHGRNFLSDLQRRLIQESATKDLAYFKKFSSINFSGELRMLKRQRRGIRYLSNNIDRRTLAEIAAAEGRPVVVLAAHFQPEATTFPEGGELSTHTDICIRLRQMGYTGPILYKEHTTAFAYRIPVVKHTRTGMYRSEEYYRQLHDLGCIFVSPFEAIPLSSIQNTGFIPITMTGTIAVERALIGLKTITTGFPWYRGLPGVIELNSIKKSIDDFLEDQVVNERQQEIALNAFEFIHSLLSIRTITNAPGIGTGIPLTSIEEKAAFASELNALLEALHGWQITFEN